MHNQEWQLCHPQAEYKIVLFFGSTSLKNKNQGFAWFSTFKTKEK